MSGGPDFKGKKLNTRLAHAGRARTLTGGGANPVVQRASTVLVEKAEDLYAPGVWTYGRHGTTTHEALREALRDLEGAAHCVLAPSGLQACTLPFLALAKAGAHVLVGDNVYGPTRRFCERTLRRWGCEVEYFDTSLGGDIATRFRANTALLFFESPGSLTFEIADVPAIAAAARKAGVATVLDNTWSAGVFLKPLDLGVDISVHSNSKYASGGADVLSGAVLTQSDGLFRRLKDCASDLGLNTSPDDAYLVLRGLRSLGTRLAQAQESALTIAAWLKQRPDVQRVLYPCFEDDPGHGLWKRDFTGASGLFGFVLQPQPAGLINAFLNRLELFGLGFSYGGFESLAICCDPQLKRSVMQRDFGGPLLRLSIGLEDPADLIADLERGFEAIAVS